MRRFPGILSWSVLILAVASLPAVAIWSGVEDDQMISYDDDEYARAVQIHISGYDVLHVFWSEDSPSVREIHYGRAASLFADDWTSIIADRVISFPDGNDVWPEECDVASWTFAEPMTIVVWSEDDGETREVHYGVSNDLGETWSSETADLILSDPTTAVDTNVPSIACDWDGVFHVVWHQSTPDGGPAEVHYSRSADAGATWSGQSADRIISFPDGNPAVSPAIARDGLDRLYVVWRENDDSGDPAIHVGISTDGGDTWSSETADRAISGSATFITDLAIAAESCVDDEAHVVYRASFDTESPFHYEIYSTTTYDGGEGWDGEGGLIPVSFDEGGERSASNPDVFFGWSQGVYAVWNEEEDASETAEQHISHLENGWTGATADQIISFPDGENGYRPSITGVQCTATADLPLPVPYDTFVAWTEFAGGSPDNYEVHLSAETFIVSDAPDGEDPLEGRFLRAVPNPAEATTRIEWSRPSSGLVAIEVFDAAGRLVHREVASSADGIRAILWDGTDRSGREVPAGLYYARIVTPERTRAIPIVRF